jgi:uncharacterized protein YaiL (DUF2058 family)
MIRMLKRVSNANNGRMSKTTSTASLSTTNGKVAKRRTKNRAAVALGKLGGKKGGLARARNLSAAQRTAIAKKAAKARWKKARLVKKVPSRNSASH